MEQLPVAHNQDETSEHSSRAMIVRGTPDSLLLLLLLLLPQLSIFGREAGEEDLDWALSEHVGPVMVASGTCPDNPDHRLPGHQRYAVSLDSCNELKTKARRRHHASESPYRDIIQRGETVP